MNKPIKPNEEDCCNSGCNPCIFDVYEKQLQLWNSKKLAESSPIFNPIKFQPFKLLSIKNITCDINLYTFQSINENNENITSLISFKMGDYAILKACVDCETISRPYTIINNNFLQSGCFQVIIKIYNDGKMSKFLKDLEENCVLYWRGLYNNFMYKKTDFLILLGAGTGVLPLYNIAYELLLNEDCETIINVICCFKNSQSMLLRDEFYELKKFWNCCVDFYVESDAGFNAKYRENVVFNKFSQFNLKEKLELRKNKNLAIVICGPEKFNDEFKGVSLMCDVPLEYIVVL